MYEYIKGLLVKAKSDELILETNGIGYLCKIPLSSFSKLPKIGEKLLLYISFVVREDAQVFYGFFTEQERALFNMVKNVSGIGPKTALALVGHLDLPLFQAAIQEEKSSIIAKVPGIGLKTASRIIVEMKDKMNVLDTLQKETNRDLVDSLSMDAIAALINLGYNQQSARKAVEKNRKNHDTLAKLIPAALQNI